MSLVVARRKFKPRRRNRTVFFQRTAWTPVLAVPVPRGKPSRLAGWGSSLLIHAGVILLGLLAYHLLHHRIKAPPEAFVVPESFGPVDPVHKGIAQNQKPSAGKINSLKRVMATAEKASRKSPTAISDLLSCAAGRKNASLIGLGSAGSIGGAMWGGGPASGNAAAFGISSGQAGHVSPISFFGVKNQASRIVLLIDHSGSMIGKLHLVKAQVRITLDQLLPFQHFAVISFAHRYKILGPDRLIAGTVRNRRRVKQLLHSVLAEGHNDDQLAPFLNAFTVAFKMKPQVIYFLTDGHFDKRLISRVAELNRHYHVQVDTFAFLDHDPLFIQHLKQISSQTNGRFVYVSRRLLSRAQSDVVP